MTSLSVNYNFFIKNAKKYLITIKRFGRSFLKGRIGIKAFVKLKIHIMCEKFAK